MRTPKGAITTFDAPGAGTGPFQGTQPATVGGLNPAGTLTGISQDASGVYHGFARASDGTFTTLDVPGAGTGIGQGTLHSMPNPPGAIVGSFVDASSAYHGFLLEGE